MTFSISLTGCSPTSNESRSTDFSTKCRPRRRQTFYFKLSYAPRIFFAISSKSPLSGAGP